MNEKPAKVPRARINYEVRDKIAHITLNRPEKLNAFTLDQTILLHETFRRFDADDEAWVAIVHGAGRAFSSGADVTDRQLQQGTDRKLTAGEPPIVEHANHGFFERTVNWKPVIAAAHGYAIGAGLMVLLECDAAIVAEDAQLQVTETSRGLWSSLHTRYLWEAAGSAFAMDVSLTGRFFTGAEAAAAGAVTRAVPADQVLQVAEELARDILKNPPLAVRHVVRARRFWMQQAVAEVPALKLGHRLQDSEDFHESARAFVERRSPAPFEAR